MHGTAAGRCFRLPRCDWSGCTWRSTCGRRRTSSGSTLAAPTQQARPDSGSRARITVPVGPISTRRGSTVHRVWPAFALVPAIGPETVGILPTGILMLGISGGAAQKRFLLCCRRGESCGTRNGRRHRRRRRRNAGGGGRVPGLHAGSCFCPLSVVSSVGYTRSSEVRLTGRGMAASFGIGAARSARFLA